METKPDTLKRLTVGVFRMFLCGITGAAGMMIWRAPNDGIKGRHGEFKTGVLSSANLPSSRAELPEYRDVNSKRLKWNQIECAEYPQYIQNLRSSGCPEATIKRLVTAELRAEYDERRRTLLQSDPIPFWHPDYGIGEALHPDFTAINEEEMHVTADLLGSVDEMQTEPGLPPVVRFGGLPDSTRERLSNIIDQTESARNAVLAAAVGRDLEQTEMEKLDQITEEKETALNQALTPAQKEEFEIRNSALAQELRDKLRSRDLELSENSFRALFRARTRFQEEIAGAATSGGDLAEAHRAYLAEAAGITGVDIE
jgi:hypothetical protein